MRFSKLLTDGMFCIKFSQGDLETLDKVFIAASHHYWMGKQAVLGSLESIYHRDACEMHCSVLTAIICNQGYFDDATDPEGLDRDKMFLWSSELSPIATRDIFCNMLPDSRFWVGASHPNDELLNRFMFSKMMTHPLCRQKNG